MMTHAALLDSLLQDLCNVYPPASPDRRRSTVARGLAFVSYQHGQVELGNFFLGLAPDAADPRGYALSHFCACVSTHVNGGAEEWGYLSIGPVKIHNPARLVERLDVDSEPLDLIDTAHDCLPMDWDDDEASKQRELEESWPDFRASVLGVASGIRDIKADLEYYRNANFDIVHCPHCWEEFLGYKAMIAQRHSCFAYDDDPLPRGLITKRGCVETVKADRQYAEDSETDRRSRKVR